MKIRFYVLKNVFGKRFGKGLPKTFRKRSSENDFGKCFRKRLWKMFQKTSSENVFRKRFRKLLWKTSWENIFGKRFRTSRETVFNYVFQSSFRYNMNLSQNGWRELLRCSPSVPYNGGHTSQILKR